WPLLTVAAVLAAFVLARTALNVPEASMTVLAGSLALYSAALHSRSRWRTPVLSLAYGVILAEVARELLTGAQGFTGELRFALFVFAYNIVTLALPWMLGSTVRSLLVRERDLQGRADELQREREENARRAVFEERVRIARELHDVVAHHVSVMGVQAAAAKRVMDRQPHQVAVALGAIEDASRQAVVELHRLLGFLRREGEVDDVAPQPGLGELPELVTQVGGTRLSVALSIDGDPRPLPRTVEVSAYRVVQEALTNTLKHSGGASASVHLRYEADALEVEVLDDGTAAPPEPGGLGGGHGLMGMRERVNLHGGHLRAGPRPQGGFAVQARFPLDTGAR
ncbi:MAG: sensor histidine kinase, partial [Acidimicrobiales bacterium]